MFKIIVKQMIDIQKSYKGIKEKDENTLALNPFI